MSQQFFLLCKVVKLLGTQMSSTRKYFSSQDCFVFILEVHFQKPCKGYGIFSKIMIPRQFGIYFHKFGLG